MAQWTAARAGGVLVNLDSQCVCATRASPPASSSPIPTPAAHIPRASPRRSDDLGCPPRSKLSAVQTGALLASRDPAALAAFDIGTWILPLAAHGALSSVVWVTQWGRIPSTAFTATLLLEHDGSLRVTGRGVPPVWRALWSGDYIEAADGSGGDVSFTPPKAAGLLGERVRARFTDRYWYGGQVVGYDAEKGTHTVAFDDGGAQKNACLDRLCTKNLTRVPDTRTDVRLDAESARGELRAEVDAARWNVGKRVRVLFADGKWWGGTTGEFDPDEGTHWVHFDDGDGRDVDLIAEAARGELRPESSSDYAATSQLHITVCMACAAVEAISAERARVGAACAPSAATTSPPWCLSLDLDFFSTRNPALRILPFDSHPSFRRALWKVASAVPIESGVLFHSALDDLLEGERAAEEVVNVILAVACGTPYEGRPSREEVEDVVASASRCLQAGHTSAAHARTRPLSLMPR